MTTTLPRYTPTATGPLPGRDGCQIVRFWFDPTDEGKLESLAELIEPHVFDTSYTLRELCVTFSAANIDAAGCVNADQFIGDLERIIDRATR